MKKKYSEPKVKVINYSYDEQVVAASTFYPGGETSAYDVDKCTRASGPCKSYFITSQGYVCDQEW